VDSHLSGGCLDSLTKVLRMISYFTSGLHMRYDGTLDSTIHVPDV
jgi:hypothetical protein